MENAVKKKTTLIYIEVSEGPGWKQRLDLLAGKAVSNCDWLFFCTHQGQATVLFCDAFARVVSWLIVSRNDVNVIVAHPTDLQKIWARQQPELPAFKSRGWST